MERDDLIDLKRLYFILRRQLKLIVAVIAVFVSIALVYIAVTPAQYRSEAIILLDKSATNTISNVSSLNLTTFEPAAIASEVELIRSKRMTDNVVQLLGDQEYFKKFEGSDNRDVLLYYYLRDNLRVSRVGSTYALSIQYQSTNPQESADVANAFAQAYITDQLDSLSETSDKTLAWLQDKAQEVYEKLEETRKRLEEARTEYNRGARSKKSSTISLNSLKNIEKEAETFATIYESYLEKIRILGVEQSFPVTETRVITHATPPLGKTHPKEKIILAAAIVLGAGLGVILALIADTFDRTIKRAGQIKRELGLSFLGFLPRAKKKTISIAFHGTNDQRYAVDFDAQFLSPHESLCSETILTLKNVLDRQPSFSCGKVIGVVSTFVNEGTSFVASNLALACGLSGKSTVLFDGAIYDPNCGRQAAALDAKTNHAFPDDFILSNIEQNLSFMSNRFGDDYGQLITSEGAEVEKMIEELRERYSYTIVDLPPLYATSNLNAYINAVDYVVVVANWGKTLPNSMKFYLDLNKIPQDKILGAVLNKADMKKMRKFYGHATYSRVTK